MRAEKRGGIGGFFRNIFFPAEYSGHSPGHTLGHATLSSLGAASAKCCLSSGHTHNPGRGLCGAALHQLEALSPSRPPRQWRP